MSQNFVNPDQIRAWFSRAMSDMYKSEVPLYDTLLDLVADVNAKTLAEPVSYTHLTLPTKA